MVETDANRIAENLTTLVVYRQGTDPFQEALESIVAVLREKGAEFPDELEAVSDE